MIYLNEIDPYAAAWLRELYPDAIVDDRSITDVRAIDLVGFCRVHLFAGVGGWERALELAGWPDDLPVWTGSCPCQPFSVAGEGKGTKDERHFWPEFRRFVSECLPPIVFGEQVASRAGRAWLAGVRADLEKLGYAVGAADLCAACAGAPHIRQRLYWGAVKLPDAHTTGFDRETVHPGSRQPGQADVDVAGGGSVERMGDPLNARSQGQRASFRGGPVDSGGGLEAPETSCAGGVSDAMCAKRDPGASDVPGECLAEAPERAPCQLGRSGVPGGFWSRYDVISFSDGKARRIEPETQCLVAGLPRGVGYSGDPGSPGYAQNTAEARTMRLRGYGNAIVPQLAAVFVRAFMEVSG